MRINSIIKIGKPCQLLATVAMPIFELERDSIEKKRFDNRGVIIATVTITRPAVLLLSPHPRIARDNAKKRLSPLRS